MPIQITLYDLLIQFTANFLEEACPHCHTLHPRYLWHYFQGPSGQPETYPVPELLAFLQGLPNGAATATLALACEWDGSLVCDPETHRPYARIIDCLEMRSYPCLERDHRKEENHDPTA